MKDNELEKEITSIRQLMERSSKFISLSGLSGVMAGVYALAGAYIAYRTLDGVAELPSREHYLTEPNIVVKLLVVGILVIVLAIANGVWLTVRNAKKKGQKFWNTASRNTLANIFIPMLSGGLFILILLDRGYFGLVAPACLLFYGIALINGSHYTFSDVKWLGLCQIVLGLLAALFPGCGLLLWVTGFGVLNILYGIMMYYKYDR